MGKVRFEMIFRNYGKSEYRTNTDEDVSGDYWPNADYRALQAKLAALVDAAKALCDKLKLVHDSAEYEAVWHISQSHVGPYKGPQYDKELDALKSALDAAKEVG